MNFYSRLSSTRKIRPKRRHNASSRNPLKTMSACLEVRSEYTEIMTGVADKELKRIQTAKSKFLSDSVGNLTGDCRDAILRSHCVVSLSKTLYPLLSTGSTQHDLTGNCPVMTEKLLTGL